MKKGIFSVALAFTAMSIGGCSFGSTSYHMSITSEVQDLVPGKMVELKYQIYNEEDVLRTFNVVHKKIMHFIAVRKDLSGFQHLHPDFDPSTGEFSQEIIFPSEGVYRLFSNFSPEGVTGEPLVAFADVEVGDLSKYKPLEMTADGSFEKEVEGYSVTYIQDEEFVAQEETSYAFKIQKNGELVTDLQPYLGALAHSIVLRADSLDFVHNHPAGMDMSGMEHHGHEMTSSDDRTITFSTEFPNPGLYKIFVEFQHDGKLMMTDFVIPVK